MSTLNFPTNVLNDLDTKFTIYANAYKHYTSSTDCTIDPSCAELQALQVAESDFRQSVANASNLTTTDLSNNYRDIMKTFRANKDLHNTIDKEMEKLKDNRDIVAENKLVMDTRIFMGVCWSLFATGLLYYIFVEL